MNTIKKIPEVGDIFIIVDGKKRFISGSECTEEFINKQQAVGVVYNVSRTTFDVVAGVNDKMFQYTIAGDLEITKIPAESGDLAVTLQGASVGTFTYTKTDGTKAEFVTQLNTWLETNAPKWEAYMENEEVAILQLSDFDSNVGTCKITNCTLQNRIGSEIAFAINSRCRNQALQKTISNGYCRAKLEEYVTNNTSASSNPTTRMNGTTQLFVNNPCSKAYYDGELGDGLRENFSTYQDYLDACMVRTKEIDVGIMQYDGKTLADKLLNKKLLVRGVKKSAYPAAVWANELDSGVEGYGPGTFHFASLSEMSILMRNITYGTSLPIDLINISLGKRTNWSRIDMSYSRFSSCLYSTMYRWLCSGSGVFIRTSLAQKFHVLAVASFTLD